MTKSTEPTYPGDPANQAAPPGAELSGTISEAEERFERGRQTFGLIVGPIIFFAMLLFPIHGLTLEASRLAAVLILALLWWMTEAVPIPVTALLAPALCVLLGIGDAKKLLAGFSDPIVFLFIGSFILARAMTLHQLDRRFALSLLSLRWVGNSTRRLLFAFGAIAAFISFWLSNTATTAMLLPIALGIIAEVGNLLSRAEGKAVNVRNLRFSTAMMLLLAYGASVGGLGTPIGTPPNLIGIGQIREHLHIRITFLEWMRFAVPITVVMYFVLYFLVIRIHPLEVLRLEGLGEFIEERRKTIGKWTRGQINSTIAFLVAVVLWVAPGVLAIIEQRFKGTHWTEQYSKLLPEGIVGILSAGLLFLLPVNWRERRFTLSWAEAVQIDWGTILLFGSGITLGGLAFDTGLAERFGSLLLKTTGANGVVSITILATGLAILLSEATSNTAAATMIVPLTIAVAQQAKIPPLPPALGACFGASFGFMLPVSTAPNAIVYGTGMVPILKMVKTGIIFDLIGWVLISAGILLMVR